MFQVALAISVPIYDTAKTSPNVDNRTFLQNHLMNLLTSAFPHLQK